MDISFYSGTIILTFHEIYAGDINSSFALCASKQNRGNLIKQKLRILNLCTYNYYGKYVGGAFGTKVNVKDGDWSN